MAVLAIDDRPAALGTGGLVVYFSSVTNNTHRFVQKLGVRSVRLPIRRGDGVVHVDEPYVLVVPTYGAGNGRGAVPKQVIRFLNDPDNRAHIRGVIAAGNTNFGEGYCLAGDIISAKCQVPHMYRFEMMGTQRDVEVVQRGLADFWSQPQNH